MDLSIIIPCQDENENISKVSSLIIKTLNSVNFEIIFINDFSKDSTLETLKKISQENRKILYFDNKQKGLGNALKLGISKSNGKFIAIMMCDLSDSLEDLKNYFDIISKNENLDAILGSRFIRGGRINNYPMVKLIMNRIFNLIVKIMFLSNYNDFTNAFKIYKKETLLKIFPLVSENFNIFLEMPLKIIYRGYSYKIIPIT